MFNNKNIFCAFFFIILISCNQSGTEPVINDDEMIKNGSFEINNTPTLEGWQFGNRQLAELVNEAPPNGGSWSLQLISDGSPTSGYVYTAVNNIKSGDILKLSAYIKAVGTNGGGSIRFSTGQSFTLKETDKSALSNDTLWVEISLVDTLNLNPGDSVWVVLSSLPTQFVPRIGLFDLVKLESIGMK